MNVMVSSASLTMVRATDEAQDGPGFWSVSGENPVACSRPSAGVTAAMSPSLAKPGRRCAKLRLLSYRRGRLVHDAIGTDFAGASARAALSPMIPEGCTVRAASPIRLTRGNRSR